MTRTDNLAGFLRDAACARFRWGEADCATLIADWVAIETGRDGMADLRGLYADAAGARALMGVLGIAGIVGRCARIAGLARTSDAAEGDIAVLRPLSRDMPALVCGIRVGRGWAVRAEQAGLIVTPHMAPVVAWSVPGAALESGGV